jgi:hypothetical protein
MEIGEQRARLEAKAQEQINNALESVKEDLAKANKEAAKQVEEMNSKVKSVTEESTRQIKAIASETYGYPLFKETPVNNTPQPTLEKKLIFFSYPMQGYTEQPLWVNPLRQVLISAGYVIYNPWDKVEEQFGQQDVPILNSLFSKAVKSLCPILYIPEEVLLPFEAVWKIINSGDNDNNYGIIFQCLWFLTRASLIICDITKPILEAGTSQEALYARQLGIPVIGLFPPSGTLNPFIHRTTTILFSGTDLLHLLPVIKGYAPLN